MSRKVQQRMLITVSVAVLAMLAVATVAGAASMQNPYEGSRQDAVVTPEAVVVGGSRPTPVVYVATALNFPDALGAGPAAAIDDAPILLVSQNSIPPSTAAELNRLDPHAIFIVGGTLVISPAVETELQTYATTVQRLSGTNRYETAAAISNRNFPAPHTFMVYDTDWIQAPTIGDTCVSDPELEVPITVPGPGTIVVTANIIVWTDHTADGLDTTEFFIGDTRTDCAYAIGWGADASYISMSGTPGGNYTQTLFMKKIIHVNSPGTHYFYATGRRTQGNDLVKLNWSYMDAMFIPDVGT